MKKLTLILTAILCTLFGFSQTRDYLYKVNPTTGEAAIITDAKGDSVIIEFASAELAKGYHDSVENLSKAIQNGQSVFKNISNDKVDNGGSQTIVMITLPNGTTMSEAAFLALPPRVQKRMMRARQSVLYASNGSNKIRLTAEQPMSTPVATNYDRQSGYLSNQTSVKQLYVNEYGQIDQYSETKKRGLGQLFDEGAKLVINGLTMVVGTKQIIDIFQGRPYNTGFYGGNQYYWMNNLMYMLQGGQLQPCGYINPMYMTNAYTFNGLNYVPYLQSSGVNLSSAANNSFTTMLGCKSYVINGKTYWYGPDGSLLNP